MQNSTNIVVWYYNELLDEWTTKLTQDLIQKKNEYNYFRIINLSGNKEFYYSFEDYLNHKSNYINLSNEITDINNKILWKIV